MTTGEKIKRIRKLRGWTQQDFANELNISSTTISFYESGKTKITADILKKMAITLDVSSDYLLGLTDSTKQFLELNLTKCLLTDNEFSELISIWKNSNVLPPIRIKSISKNVNEANEFICIAYENYVNEDPLLNRKQLDEDFKTLLSSLKKDEITSLTKIMYASYQGLELDGLDNEDIDELQAIANIIKRKKGV